MLDSLIEKVTEKQAFLDLFGTYTFKVLRDTRESYDGELQYRKKMITSKVCRTKFDHNLHKLHHAKTTVMEKLRIRYQILNLVMNKNFKKLRSSKGLISKYCLLFPDHESLLDDWLKMWNMSYLFFNTNKVTGETTFVNKNKDEEYNFDI
jgi:hypothetical protein